MDVTTLDAGYAAATGGVALLDRSERGKLALDGPDAAACLDAVLSNDIAALGPGTGADATLLTHKGRLLAEVRVLATEQKLLLDTDRVSLQSLFDALRQFRIGYRTQLHKRTLECALLSMLGPGADALLASPPPAIEHSHRTDVLAGRPVRTIRTDLGVDVLCDREHADTVRGALLGAGAVAIGEDVAETLRIEHGRPRFGVEIDEDTMPQEAGLHERGVSYSKGCYIGQETVARLYWKGRPNRHLRGLRLSGPVAPGARLALGGRAVGSLGSVATSPRLGTIGLALLRREAEPGAVLAVGEDGSASATVVELPFR